MACAVTSCCVVVRELVDRRNELLREMFGLIKYARYTERADSLETPSGEEMDAELEKFLERFDLQKKCVPSLLKITCTQVL